MSRGMGGHSNGSFYTGHSSGGFHSMNGRSFQGNPGMYYRPAFTPIFFPFFGLRWLLLLIFLPYISYMIPFIPLILLIRFLSRKY